MKVGADRKKVGFLIALGLLGAYLFYSNVLSDSGGTPARRPDPQASAVGGMLNTTAPPTAAGQGPVRRSSTRNRASDEFRPSLKRKPEDKLDPGAIDPTLRLDLLAKVQSVELQGGARNLFQFSAAPPPPLPKDVPKVVPKTPAQIAAEKKQAPPPGSAVKPATPPPAPINLKYFGYSMVKGEDHKKAFFLEGDDIYVASEGDIVKKRYRVVRIGVNSVVMEDTDSKHQQTLPLQEESAG